MGSTKMIFRDKVMADFTVEIYPVWALNSSPNDKIFRLVQTQSIYAQQKKCNLTTDALFEMGGKHCGKRRKCWLPAFSPSLTMFLKGFFFRVVKSRDYELNSHEKENFKNMSGKGKNAGN